MKPSPLKSIMPSVDQCANDTLHYPKLREIVEQFYSEEYETVDEIFDRFDLSEDSFAGISNAYFPVIALKIQEARTPMDQVVWSERLTQLSLAQFGQPDELEVQGLIGEEYAYLSALQQRHSIDQKLAEPLLATYKRVLDQFSGAEVATSHHYTTLLISINEYLHERYRHAFDTLKKYKDTDILTVQDITVAYEQMMQRIAENVPRFRDWRVVLTDSTQMAVSPRRKHVQVGRFLPPLTALRVKSLFTHEVLVHAQRSVRGSGESPLLAYGLPGYMTAEEGLGSLMEAAIEKKMPHRIVDRYIDIALALGFGELPALTRKQLFAVAYGRTLLRQKHDGLTFDDATTRLAVWQHVNRIYRGTLGNDIIGVVTKDLIYYRGFQEMAEYLSRYRSLDLKRAIDFVLSGKMNPLSPSHRLYVHKRRFNVTTKRRSEI